MQHQVTIHGTEHQFLCRADRSVLAAMVDCGQDALVVGCRSGGCGVCRVEVMEGQYHTGQMSGAQISALDRVGGVVLACQLFPRSALVLQVPARRAATAACSERDRFERMRQQVLILTRKEA